MCSLIINVILSGGIGSRLWPLSRKSRPKQFLPIFDGQSLFEKTIERNQSISQEFIAVGNQEHQELTRQSFTSFTQSPFSIISEAFPRNTAAAIAFPCIDMDPSTILVVTPSDHIIQDQPAYIKAMKQGIALAASGNLVCFGVKPTHPETGFGYVEHEGFDVKSFREKPDASTAASFIEQGNFLWNAGIFCFQAGVYLEELGRYEPEILERTKEAWSKNKDRVLPTEESLAIPSKSIDYAVMEKSDKIKVVPADFAWSDLGSFDAIWDFQESQESVSIAPYKNLALSANNKHVEFLGVKDLIVVETDDAILILPRHQSQQVKQVYERLEKENSILVS
jgi:mannose-1-phosphate guanylyltransferase